MNLRRTLGYLHHIVEFVDELQQRQRNQDHQIRLLQTRLEALRSHVDVPAELLEAFHRDRLTDTYSSVYEKPEPLVTVCIGTYNRSTLLLERSLRSVLAQTYRNLDVVVVGDHCTDDTEERMADVHDERVRFVNLDERGAYPDDPRLRWMVAGSVPFSRALALASGDFVTHLDDDDEYLPGRIEGLVSLIKSSRADVLWHPFWHEIQPGKWVKNDALEFAESFVTTSSVLYHRWFARIPWDINAYKLQEPGDWNRFRKFKYLGARAARHPEPYLRHYAEGAQGKT